MFPENAYSVNTRRCLHSLWDELGSFMLGAGSHDSFGCSASMHADGVTIAVDTSGDDDYGHDSGHVRVFTYSSKAKKLNELGNGLVGAASLLMM